MTKNNLYIIRTKVKVLQHLLAEVLSLRVHRKGDLND